MPIPIAAFPYTFDMVAAHAGGPSAGAVANADGRNTLSNTGGWNNGPWSRIVPPSIEEIYCGFGNFFFPANTTRFNVRCMIRAGNELYRTTGSKMVIGNLNAGASGDRAMGISAEGVSPHAFTHWSHASRNINAVTSPATYPNAGPFHFASAAVPKSAGNYQGEWVCYEYEAVIGGSVSVYIHTQDGLVAKGPGNAFSSSAYPVAGTFLNFGLGWYWGPNQGAFPGLYLDVGDVVVSNQYIGPPTGFLNRDRAVRTSIAVTGRCAGLNHVHLTITARNDSNVIIGTKNITWTPDDIFGIEPGEFLDRLPNMVRSHLLEQGATRQTPFAQIKTLIESKVFYL